MEKKAKVLLIAFNDLGHGGIQGVIMTTVRGLSKVIDFDIVVFTDKECFYDKEFERYGRIFHIPIYSGSNRLVRKSVSLTKHGYIEKKIYKILKENGPYDVVHSHAFFDSAPCMTAAKKAGVPIRITHSHNTGIAATRKTFIQYVDWMKHECLRKEILKNSTALIGCSRKAGDYLFGENIGLVIYNGIDVGKFNPMQYANKHDSQRMRILQVGNFCKQKNQLYSVEIMRKLCKKDENIILTMIGQDSDYKNKVVEKIDAYGLQHNIVLLPHNSDIPKEMSQSDCFLLPSLFEGFPLVLMEAQSMGLKCFVSCSITQESNLGLLEFLDNTDKPEVWADAMYRYLTEQPKSIFIPDMQRFTVETFLNSMLAQYIPIK